MNNEVEYVSEGVPFIRGINMKKGRIQFNDMLFITQEANRLLWKSEVKPGMILLSMSGTIGEVALASEKWKYPMNSNQDIAKIDTVGKLNKYYLYAFLLSKYGQNYLIREARGSVQQHVFLSQIEKFEIPEFSALLINNIQAILETSDFKNDSSKQAYSQAETLLLQSIGLQDFKPSAEAVNIKSFKDSFETSGRLDAEYYQKKYEDYILLAKNYSNGWQPLNKACNVNDNNFNPSDTIGYNYIELSDIGKTGDITGCTTAYGSELPSRARRVVNTGDVVISSIEGSLGSCAMVQAEYNNALCSTGFYVINSSKINAATLLVLFKSEVMQKILKQGCSGTILTAINKNEFLNMPVPLIEQNIQNQILVSIDESFRLKKQSEHLLEVAKKAVEMAIEEGEERAKELISRSL